MRTQWALLLLLLLSVLTGCSEYGQPYDASHAKEVRVGTDKSVIRGWFGDPLGTRKLDNGRCAERWMWFYGRSAMGSVSKSLAVDFDGNGKVCK